jgi:hypothetical protein
MMFCNDVVIFLSVWKGGDYENMKTLNAFIKKG